ncbi:MAG: monofunctional biosynthetic peptidoglycan transglycosylase [Thermoanaerobaculia bacterium]|nr:monofunctional biosynthetic peptidoglycan transglycosylase [Thermoanaerobaculia bacterium]
MRSFLRWSLRLALGGLALLALVALYQWLTWPDVAALATENPKSSAFIARFERQSGKKAVRTWVPYARISSNLKRAVVVGEDINFFSHQGFDVAEMKKAWAEAKEEGRAPRGASTITQQLAKNLWLSPSRNPWRKVKEAMLTRQLEKHLEKRRILEIYLNVAEFGTGLYGAEAASRKYFGKPAANLTELEAAQLAASLPNPDDWHPGSTRKGYQRRVRMLVGRMAKAGWVGREV